MSGWDLAGWIVAFWLALITAIIVGAVVWLVAIIALVEVQSWRKQRRSKIVARMAKEAGG